MFGENDEHFIALSNVMAQCIESSSTNLAPLFEESSSDDHSRRSQSPGRRHSEGDSSKEIHENLYKTELCRTWEASHNCQYGMKCRFAHGAKELRPVMRHPKYKTQLCKTFREHGHCPYGPRCLFIHEEEESRHKNSNTTTTTTKKAGVALSNTVSFATGSLGRSITAVAAPPFKPSVSATKAVAVATSDYESTKAVAVATSDYESGAPQAAVSSSEDQRQRGRGGRLQFFEVISQESAEDGE